MPHDHEQPWYAQWAHQRIHELSTTLYLRDDHAKLRRLLELAEYLECEQAERELSDRTATCAPRPAPEHLAPLPPHVGQLVAGGALPTKEKRRADP